MKLMLIKEIWDISLSATMLFWRRILVLVRWIITFLTFHSSLIAFIFIWRSSLNFCTQDNIFNWMNIVLIFFYKSLWIINFFFVFLFVSLNACVFFRIVFECRNIFVFTRLPVFSMRMIITNAVTKKWFILFVLFFFLNNFIKSFMATYFQRLITLMKAL